MKSQETLCNILFGKKKQQFWNENYTKKQENTIVQQKKLFSCYFLKNFSVFYYPNHYGIIIRNLFCL